jgi:hypothetical protein
MILQQLCSLSVSLILMTTKRKILTRIEGKYVKTMFLKTNFITLRYLPGASFYLYNNLVMNIIQKSELINEYWQR